MLESYPMVRRNGLLAYPEKVRERFIATGPLPLRDGTQVSAEEIWEFMNEEGQTRFPYAFTSNPNSAHHLPFHIELLSSIKAYYLTISRRFRVESLRKQGKPLIWVQGGQTLEPYYAAEAVPLRSGDIRYLAVSTVAEGMDQRKMDWKQADLHEAGNRVVSMEACHQIIGHSAIRSGLVPVALIAPYTRARCSDVTFLVESHRDSPMKTPTFLVDIPVNYEPHKVWMVEYVAQGVRRLISRIDSLAGRTTTEDDFRTQIRAFNRIRRLTREIVELWRFPDVPPASSAVFRQVFTLAKDCDGDPVAAEHILALMRDEVLERVSNSVRGAGLAENPLRIFHCGSCFNPNVHRLDEVGGVLVGVDDRWHDLWMPGVLEAGDIYENYAKTILEAPYDLPTEKRARWIVEQIKESRADGLIFGYQWGCNFQSAVARLVCDIVGQETDIPSLILGIDELGRSESLEQTGNRVEAFVEMLSCAS